MIEFRNVRAGYGGGDVLQGLDLRVESGSITCIVGPNGAGKSTVLRALSGLLRPRLGEIVMDDRALHSLSPAEVLAAGVAQVPQQGGLFGGLSIRDNMLLGGYQLRRQRRELNKRIDELADVFPIVGERALEKAADLSGGQRRIVEFARALVTRPRVILLDEPTLGLDPKTSAVVFQSIQRVNSRGTTVLMVEQNVRFGLQLAHHGVVMERGRVLIAQPAEALLARSDMASMFFGASPGEPDPELSSGRT